MEFKFNKWFKQEQKKEVNKTEGLDKKTTRKIESGKEQYGEKFKAESRLTESEAYIYQDYATNKEHIPFSEKAQEKSYNEAEMLLARLREKKFDWLNIDWDKIDLRKIQQYEETEKRLSIAVRELAKSTKNPGLTKILAKCQGKTLALALSVSLLLSFSPEEGKAQTNQVKKLRIGEQNNSANKFDLKFYSPYIDIEKRKFNWKAILEPLAISISKEKDVTQSISFDIPYEYARLFDTGKPLSEEDYQKVNNYIKEKITEQLESSIYAFSFDKKSFKEKFPEYIKEMKLKVDKILILGVASPEARERNSELPEKIDRENIKLSKLRALDSLERVKTILEELGINYSPEEIKIDSFEDQFSPPEFEALAKVAEKEGVSTFDLIKDYNDGKIANPEVVNILDSLIASKRKVIVSMDMQDGSQKILIIPLPIILGAIPLLEYLRRRRQFKYPPTIKGKISLTEEKIKKAQKGESKKNEMDLLSKTKFKPLEPIAEQVFEVEKTASAKFSNFIAPYKKISETKDILAQMKIEKNKETYIYEIEMDILKNFDFYENIAKKYENFELEDRKKSINTIAHQILKEWMEIDNKNRESAGQPPENYYQRVDQITYALLHASIVRRIVLMEQKNRKFSEMSEAEYIHEIRTIIREEIENFFKA